MTTPTLISLRIKVSLPVICYGRSYRSTTQGQFSLDYLYGSLLIYVSKSNKETFNILAVQKIRKSLLH